MRSNQLQGPIPESLAKATALESLFLSNNELRGPIPSALGDGLTRLQARETSLCARRSLRQLLGLASLILLPIRLREG